jgi:hypothetical protein
MIPRGVPRTSESEDGRKYGGENGLDVTLMGYQPGETSYLWRVALRHNLSRLNSRASASNWSPLLLPYGNQWLHPSLSQTKRISRTRREHGRRESRSAEVIQLLGATPDTIT